ncbi:hypothetical protein ACFX19_045161 [Malus domestica]
MERYYAVKQNQNLSRTHSSSSKTLRCLNPAYFDVQMPPSQDPNPMNTTSTASTSAMELKPPLPVKCPMLPSAWILNSELQKKI